MKLQIQSFKIAKLVLNVVHHEPSNELVSVNVLVCREWNSLERGTPCPSTDADRGCIMAMPGESRDGTCVALVESSGCLLYELLVGR